MGFAHVVKNCNPAFLASRRGKEVLLSPTARPGPIGIKWGYISDVL
jgi:hypothetical protein